MPGVVSALEIDTARRVAVLSRNELVVDLSIFFFVQVRALPTLGRGIVVVVGYHQLRPLKPEQSRSESSRRWACGGVFIHVSQRSKVFGRA